MSDVFIAANEQHLVATQGDLKIGKYMATQMLNSFQLKISQLEKENADLKARLAHVEKELEEERSAVEFYADSDNLHKCDFLEKVYFQGICGFGDEIGTLARQRIKERKEFK